VEAVEVEPQSPMRSEQAIFDELAKVCRSPGYVHAIAYLCFRDNMIRYSGEMKPEDMRHMFSENRLIRTETSTLIGLLIKNDIDHRVPAPNVLQQYICKTEALLDELHQSMSAVFWASLDPKKVADRNFSPFTNGEMLREPIFYGGESAYSFQYRDLSPKKYARDNDWLTANKGFSIQAARDVVHAIGRLQDGKSIATLHAMRATPTDQWTFLPGYTFTAKEVAAFAGIDVSTVANVLKAFALPQRDRNLLFTALHDFNVANALPLIPLNEDRFVLFHIYSLTEALYESPFYWMGADKAYASAAMRHRGLFTEECSLECLTRVFGRGAVYSNVDIFGPNAKTTGEIDVLVLFGNRAVVLQAKSKRLTLEARRGNDGQIRDDFKKSIQDSCDQAYKCARMVGDTRYTLRDSDSNEIAISMPIKDVYVLCVVSDHYPALSFQARQFLQRPTIAGVSPPFVLDVFTLDAMTEMLESPLQWLSYVDRRTKYGDRLMASHETTILSYHLKHNLWLSEEHDMVTLHDDISTDLDLAMLARREGVSAERTPDGILTRFTGTTLGGLLKKIEAHPDPGTIDLGFMLLTLGEKTALEVSKGIEELAKRGRADGRSHDLTVGLGKGGTGFTVHCNNAPIEIAGPLLQRHCHARKYAAHAQTWYGVCVRPSDASLRFGLSLDYAWERDDEMDTLTVNMAKPGNLSASLKHSTTSAQKIGRNEACPCGSGKKYKKCCLPR
jgi:hypothetical protein